MSGQGGLDIDHMIRRAPRTAETSVDDEVIVLLIDEGACFGFNVTASHVWRQVGETPIRLADILGRMTAEFDVEPADCERGLLGLVEELRREGLVEVVAG